MSRLGLRLLTLLALGCALGASPAAGVRAAPPFTFCYGLERGGSPTVLQDLGLNTLYIDLLPADMADLEPCRAMIRSARQAGLQVVIGLPTCLTSRYHVSPYDEGYTGSVRELITYFVTALREEPGVTAWGTGHALEKSITYSEGDFRRYLQAGYPDLAALNASWGTALQTWPQFTRGLARETDSAAPFAVGRASLDLANYQAFAYREVMRVWLETIRALDPERPVLTGRVTLYRSLLSIPEGYDVVCVSMPPDVLESDLATHNVQALDIARRGGKFRVLTVLRVPSNASPAYSAEALRDWIQQGALHGSLGFGLEDWSLLADIYATERRLVEPRRRQTINAVSSCRSLAFGFTPRPTSAVVYSPYAEGFEVTGQPIDLGHVQPTAMLGRVDELETVPQLLGFGRWEGFIERTGFVGVQVVHH